MSGAQREGVPVESTGAGGKGPAAPGQGKALRYNRAPAHASPATQALAAQHPGGASPGVGSAVPPSAEPASRHNRAPRVRILDILRGFSVISMVAYHGMYDLVYMGGVRAAWYTGLPGYIWQQSICWVFILVSGASLHYGRRTARRGLIVLGCALAVSLVTRLAMPSMFIAFGILHMTGCAMLLAALAWPLLQKIPPAAGLAVSGALFVLLRGLPRGFIGLLDRPLLNLPAWLYGSDWLAPLGLPGPGFSSADYFPLIPWVFLFFAGYFLWGLVKQRFTAKTPGKNPLEWTGRHSLPIYMAHQVLLYVLFLGVDALFLSR